LFGDDRQNQATGTDYDDELGKQSTPAASRFLPSDTFAGR
jgi:hypothetical protein